MTELLPPLIDELLIRAINKIDLVINGENIAKRKVLGNINSDNINPPDIPQEYTSKNN